MPNGADAERRQMPKVREMPEGALQAVRVSAQSGVPRCLAFRAVWHLAPSGIWRRLAFRAFSPAPFGPCAVSS